LFRKIYRYIEIIVPALCLSISANATDGFYENSKASSYNFMLMNNEFRINSLMNSVLKNDYKATSVFIASGDDVNAKNIAGCTPLHFASRNGNSEIVKLLLDNRAKVNIKDEDGWTPLMRASMSGDSKSVEYLINADAKGWYLNKWGESALIHSAMSNCSECAKKIIEKTDLKKIKNREPLKKQVLEAKEIVNKKYNEDFKKILKDFEEALNVKPISKEKLSKIKIVVKPDAIEDELTEEKDLDEKKEEEKKVGFFKKIIYVFTGKKVSDQNGKTPEIKETIKEVEEKELERPKETLEKKETIKKEDEIEEINLNEEKSLPKKKIIEEKIKTPKKTYRPLKLLPVVPSPRKKPVFKDDGYKKQSIIKKENITRKKDKKVNQIGKTKYGNIVPRKKIISKEKEIKEISLNTKKEKKKPIITKRRINKSSPIREFGNITPKGKVISKDFDNGAKINEKERKSLIEEFLR
jgi:hypothetical protein